MQNPLDMPAQSIPYHEASTLKPKIIEQPGGEKVLLFDDGSMVENPTQVMGQSDEIPFEANLIEYLPPEVVNRICSRLWEDINEDKASQQPAFDAAVQAVKQLALEPGDESVDPGKFEGASNVTSQAMFDALLNILAMLRKHLYKANDMVDTTIVGPSDQDQDNTATRLKTYMNYFLTYEAKEFRKESLRGDMWAVLVGSSYKKVYIDPELGRPTSLPIPVQDFIVHRSYATHHSARRKTQRIKLTSEDLKFRVDTGMYRHTELTPLTIMDMQDELQETLDKTIGHQPADGDRQTLFSLYECHALEFIPEDPLAANSTLPCPYIITLDEETGVGLSIYRNWKKEDTHRKERRYFINRSCFPALHGEGYGLSNYATRLSSAATTITQQLVNAGIMSNFPGGFIRGGMRLPKNNFSPGPQEYVPLPPSPSDDISKDVMPLPYGPPSPALVQLRNEIEDNIRRPFMVMSEKVVDMATRAPQGTVLFLLDQLHQVPNALMQGFYESFAEELELIRERIEEWLPANMPYPFEVGDQKNVVMKADFSGAVKIFPCADPSLPSSSYRMLQAELVLDKSTALPQYHNVREALIHYYQNLGMGDNAIEKVLLPVPPTPPQPMPLGPVEENAHLLTGVPVVAGIDQDHRAHEIVHSVLFTHPDPNVAAAAQAHAKEHQAYAFMIDVYTQAGIPIPQDPSQIPMPVQNEIAQRAAQVVLNQQQDEKGSRQPSLADLKAAELAQKREVAQLQNEVKMAELKIEQERLRVQMQLGLSDAKEKETANVARIQLEQLKFEHEKALKELELQIKLKETSLKEREEFRKQNVESTLSQL